MRCTATLPALAFATIATVGDARAQDAAALASRRQLLADAQTASDSNDHVRALNLARQAGSIRMTPSVQMFIAQEEETLGQNDAALADAQDCEEGALADHTLHERDIILRNCRAVLSRVRGRLADPTAVDGQPSEQPEPDPQPSQPASSPQPAIRASTSPRPPSTSRERADFEARTTLDNRPWYTIATGTIEITLGIVLPTLADSVYNGRCPTGCTSDPTEAQQAVSERRTYGDIALIFGIAGSIVTLGGGIWLAYDVHQFRRTHAMRRPAAFFVPVNGGGAIGITGRF